MGHAQESERRKDSAPAAPEGPRFRGVVKWWDDRKGWGFITPNERGQQELFVHFKNMRGKGYRTLNDGDEVEYAIVEQGRGPCAFDVVVTKRAPVES